MYLNEQTINEVFDILVMSAEAEGEPKNVFLFMDKWYIESFIYGLNMAQEECIFNTYTKEEIMDIYRYKVRQHVGEEDWQFYLEEEE